MITGEVVNVTEHTAGSELATTAINAGTITVVDIDEYDLDGGQVTIGTVTTTYTVPDTEGDDLVLGTTLTGTYAAGQAVTMYPETKERFAEVSEPDGQEILEVRIPHALFPMLPTGARVVDDGSAEIVEADYSGTDLVITDVIGKEPVYTGAAFQTSEDDPKVRMDETGLFVTESGGTIATKLDDTGLYLREATGAANDPPRSIRWLDDSDFSTLRAYVQDYYDGTKRTFTIRVPSPSAEWAEIDLQGRPADNTGLINVTTGSGTTSEGFTLLGFDPSTNTSASDWVFDKSDGWQTWSPSFTGWSTNPASGVYRYTQYGDTVQIMVAQPTAGTSNATTKTLSLPVTAATVTNGRWEGACRAVDNGVAQTASNLAIVTSAGTTVSFHKDWTAAGGWTASGDHRIVSCMLSYEVA